MSACTVYLIHFNTAYKHAKHYLGSAKDLEQRLEQHRMGRGARLIEVIQQHGISWEVVRTWTATRKKESQLKKQGGRSRLCPVCKAAAATSAL